MRRTTMVLGWALAAWWTAGCGADASSGPEGPVDPGGEGAQEQGAGERERAPTPSELSATNATMQPSGILDYQIGGIWVFQHDPPESLAALLTAVARIDGDCLYVGDSVVIWHRDRESDAREAVAAVQAGVRLEVSVGGGNPTADEPERVDAARQTVSARCGTTNVHMAGPGPATFRDLDADPDGAFAQPCVADADGTDSCEDGWECRPASDVVQDMTEPFLCTRPCEMAEGCPWRWTDHCGDLRHCGSGVCGYHLCD